MDETEAVYNTMVPIVANVRAVSPADAILKVRAALIRAGFDIYDDGSEDAFEAEENTTVTLDV